MERFMVVARFKPGTSWDDVMAVVPNEQRVVEELRKSDKLGQLYLATAARQTVFLEIFARNQSEAEATVQTLPMARWWELDIFPLNAPAGIEVES